MRIAAINQNNFKNNKQSFGIKHGLDPKLVKIRAYTLLASDAMNLYEMRKGTFFYSLFPFFNRKPRTEFHNGLNGLVGERFMSVEQEANRRSIITDKLQNFLKK